MSRTKINGRGVITSAGSGLKIAADVNNSGFGPYALSAVTHTALSNTLTAKNAGINFLAASAGEGVTIIMPTAASVPGAFYTLKNTSAGQSHTITGSQETDGTLVFTDGTDNGSRISMASALVGTSVALVSDGTSFLVLAISGSTTIAGT